MPCFHSKSTRVARGPLFLLALLLLCPTIGQGALDATPDANSTDPLIIQKAAELGNDPVRIFEFVRDEIGYESYVGSLRGARGTLWSSAGNALDQASLLVALLRASNIPAHYVAGTLSPEDARELILSMFPSPYRIVGCPPGEAERADPANNVQLLDETRQHYWVQFDDGGGFVDADPSFAAAVIGESFTATDGGSFEEIPDALRHKVTIRLKAEFFGSFPGVPPKIKMGLDETFNTVELVGRPLTIGHFVNTNRPPGLLFGYVTHTYSPYVLIGHGDADVSDDPLIRGEDYQEFLSNFALASELLTGVFLEVDVHAPGGRVETYERTLFDRIGFATRQNGGPVELGDVAGAGPALTDLDLVTINVLPGLQSLDAIAGQQQRLSPIEQEFSTVAPLADGVDLAAASPEDQALVSRALALAREAAAVAGETITMAYAGAADHVLSQLERGYLSRAYYDSPRLVMTLTKADSVKIDLRKNDLRVIPLPGQIADLRFDFEIARGLIESTLEGEILSSVTSHPVMSIADVFENISDPNDLTIITAENPFELELLEISDDAKARIAHAAARGKVIVTPRQPIDINGTLTVAWLETDPTGHTIAVTEDGGHQALVEYLAVQIQEKLDQLPGFLFGALHANTVVQVAFLANFIEGIASGEPFQQAASAAKERAREVADDVADAIEEFAEEIGESEVFGDFLEGVEEGFGEGTDIAIDWISRNVPVDPLVFPFLSSDLIPGPESIPPGATPGVNVSIVLDPFFTIPFGGAEFPSVFKAQIQNTGPTADTFVLTFSEIPAGYTLTSSVPTVTIPAGFTGEVGVCMTPSDGAIPLPLTDAPFRIDVASVTDPAVSATDLEPFVIPEVAGVVLTSDPTSLATSPGVPVETMLTLRSVGNVSAHVILEATVPSGLTLTGLQSPIDLAPGDSTTQTLTLTPDAAAPLNSDLVVTITADLGINAQGEPLVAEIPIPVLVVAPEAVTALDTAEQATRVGRPRLAHTLASLATALTSFSQDPASSIFKSRLLGQLDDLVTQLNGPVLTPFVSDVKILRAEIAIAAVDAIPGLLGDLSDLLQSIGDALTDIEALPFEAALRPNTATALPNTPTHFLLFLQNTGTSTTTFDLSLSPLPPGVMGTLNRSSVTLGPGEFIPRDGGPDVIVTLTQMGDALQAVDFDLTISIAGLPDATRTVSGALTSRDELVEIVSVNLDPPFTDPGGEVSVSARLFNAVNQGKSVLLSYEVLDASDQIILSSQPIQAQLSVLSSLDTFPLPPFDTTGLALGVYGVNAVVLDLDGTPIPGASRRRDLLIGSPVRAELAVDPEVLSPGDHVIMGSLEIESVIDAIDPTLTLLGLLDTNANALNVAVRNQIAYVCGEENISVIDVSDPFNPQLLNVIGETEIGPAHTAECHIVKDHLLVLWHAQTGLVPMHVLVYDLTDAELPQLVSNTSVNRRFLEEIFFGQDHAFVGTGGYFFIGQALIGTFGDLLAFDLTDITNPEYLDALVNDSGTDGGSFFVGEGVVLDDELALVPTTNCAYFALSCTGQVAVVDISDPSALVDLARLRVPQTTFLKSLVAQGGLAVVLGSNGPVFTPIDPADTGRTTGNLTVTTLDISDPLSPQIIATIATDVPMANLGSRAVAIGNGQFVVTANATDTSPVLVLLDINDPQVPQVTTIDVFARVREAVVDGNFLYTVSTDGLAIYDLGGVFGTRITASLELPKNTVLTGFQNQNLSRRPGVTTDASTGATGVFNSARAVDGDLTTQWFSDPGDVVNQGASPYLEVILPQESIVGEVRVFGNRLGNSQFFLSGIIQLFDSEGALLFESNEFPLPNRDAIVSFDDVTGVRRVRFVGTADIGVRVGVAEFEIIGEPETFTDYPFAGAFSLPAPEIITGPASDTFLFELGLSALRPRQTITWKSSVVDLQPGEVRDVAAGATVDFIVPDAGSGQIVLPAVAVLGEHLLGIDPDTQTVPVGGPASFDLTVKNPTDAEVSYILAVQGVPPGWVDLASPVIVPALGEAIVPLTLLSDAQATSGENGFVVSAEAGALRGVVHGTLVLEPTGGSIGDDVESFARGATLELIPSAATAGQGTAATYVARITNTGTTADTFNLSTTLPAGVQATFGENPTLVATGLQSFKEVLLTLTPSPGTPVGTIDFTAAAVSQTDALVEAQANGSLMVVGNGVDVVFDTPAGMPGGLFEVTITNIGVVPDTFGVALGGPLAPFAMLPSETVSLPAGASETLSISLGPIHFAFPGALSLTVVARSQTSPAVEDKDTATIDIAGSMSVELVMDPEVVELATPGSATFLLVVHNTGSQEDAYDVAITGSTGDVLASLRTSTGGTQMLRGIRLPGTTSGAIPLDAETSVPGQSTVTVAVTSRTDPTISAMAMGTLQVGEPQTNTPPVADAGEDQNAETGMAVELDGTNSFDPDGDLITFEWSFVSVADGSALTDADLAGRDTPMPSFVPDVEGEFVIRLIVRDFELDSAPNDVTVTVRRSNVPPNADAGRDQSVAIGDEVFLDGSGSEDPDQGPAPLRFSWRFAEKPGESLLSDDDIHDRDQAMASFLPDVPGDYVLALSVFDGSDGDSDTARIEVRVTNVPPIARAGEDRTVTVNDTVKLDGNGSHDPDSGPLPLSFSWRFVSIPDQSDVTSDDIEEADTATPRFRPDVEGSYVLELEVFDGEANAFDNVLIQAAKKGKFSDVTKLVRIRIDNERTHDGHHWKLASRTADITITNESQTTIRSPIYAVFDLSRRGPILIGAHGITRHGDFFFDLKKKTGTVELGHGESVSFSIKFVYYKHHHFSYKVKVYGVVPDDGRDHEDPRDDHSDDRSDDDSSDDD